jgi:hypothetical protein
MPAREWMNMGCAPTKGKEACGTGELDVTDTEGAVTMFPRLSMEGGAMVGLEAGLAMCQSRMI